jgi:hypothetical protein
MPRALVVLALALAAGACAGSRTVVPVTMGASASPMPRSAYELVTHEQAVDRHASFRAAFGESLAKFEQEALAHLASAVR